MSNTDLSPSLVYTLERSPDGDQYHRDSEGYLHTHSGSGHVDTITIEYREADQK
ncbi:hypothetical protein [Halomicrobium katesii]|uniref:hypothetical protein n=1 Tax=Halomicrobium katesii TaxID=437163 RepID=UPI0003748861|nr:hypothetical protein [Halomicrobium katesii]